MPEKLEKKPTIFISYSHRDLRWLEFVQGHLQVAISHDLFETWDDRHISGGSDWEREINEALDKCAAFILLVPPASLTSVFILKKEVQLALEAHWARGVHIYPIVVRACDIHAAPWLSKMNIRPRDAKALALYAPAKRDQVMAALSAEIRAILSAKRNETQQSEIVKTEIIVQKPSPAQLKHKSNDAKKDTKDASRIANILNSRLIEDINKLRVDRRIKDNTLAVAEHSEFPRWMSVEGTLVRNPVWERVPSTTVRRLARSYHPSGPNPPRLMHIDILLVRQNDETGHGSLHTYLSPDYDAYLFTFRHRLNDEDKKFRLKYNSEHIARYWEIDAKSVNIQILPGKYLTSAKQHPKYKDVILYVFEFCSVVFEGYSEWPNGRRENETTEDGKPTRRWLNLSKLRNDDISWSVNGDVIRALHEMFTYDLGPLPCTVKRNSLDGLPGSDTVRQR